MEIYTVLLTLGVLLLLVALLGQVKAQQLEVGTKNPIARIVVGIVGIAFVYIALRNSAFAPQPAATQIPPTTQAPPATAPPTTAPPTTAPLTTAPSTISISTQIPLNTQVLPTTTPAPIMKTKVSPVDGMTLHLVPAGTFIMGSNANDNEKPLHDVELLAFWMDETEVTNNMYAVCAAAGICSRPKDSSFLDNPAYKNHPVVFVRWQDARTYCEWAGRRLPTEAEWEKAARGTDTRAFPWGNAIPTNQLANFNSTGTTSVGRYPKGASPYGVLDMTGNVWEWVSSIYKAYPYNSGGGRENLNSTDDRVLRGSSWYNDITNLRLTYRGRSEPNDVSNRVGFRCAEDD